MRQAEHVTGTAAAAADAFAQRIERLPPQAVVVFYDSDCVLCAGAVRFLLDRDGGQRLYFAPLRRAAVRRFLGIDDRDDLGTMVAWQAGVRHERSDAVIHVARQLGGIWQAGAWLRHVPVAWRDAVYNWVARNRFQWFGRKAACGLPTAAERARFIDLGD
jgi:predicted DCC family thiol-disulfide oxidoreductase YuxK